MLRRHNQRTDDVNMHQMVPFREAKLTRLIKTFFRQLQHSSRTFSPHYLFSVDFKAMVPSFVTLAFIIKLVKFNFDIKAFFSSAVNSKRFLVEELRISSRCRSGSGKAEFTDHGPPLTPSPFPPRPPPQKKIN
jgi:hypothetical protein